MAKKFKLDKSEIKQLISNLGGCYASDRITVDGQKVGYMYREQPDFDVDSGWRFFAGDETPECTSEASNFEIYDVNTICNYDASIIPFLDSPPGLAFVRDPKSGQFVKECLSPPNDK